jgi:hypothetical protein
MVEEFDALDEDEFVALGAGATSCLAAADFSGALDATFPVPATGGREVCDAGSGDAIVACGTCGVACGEEVLACNAGCVGTLAEVCDAVNTGWIVLVGGVCDLGCVAAGFIVCPGEAVATFV